MSPLTPNQQRAVECCGRPLFIQAGAGTGKTFTLTKRLAHGLSKESGPLLASVDNVLTITFTNKAAAELLGRVRAELRAQGLDEAALEIDGALISTIHGMCRSILAAHALEAGIDPGMALLTGEESDALLQQAVDDELGTDEMELLVAAFGPQQSCALVSQLAGLLEMAPAGVAEFSLGPSVSSDPLKTMRALAVALASHLESLEQLGVREGPSAACAKQTDRLELAISTAERLAAEDGLAWEDVAQALECCAPPKGGSLKKVFREDFAEAFALVADTRALAASAQARARLEVALALAQRVAKRHLELKTSAGVQDTNDLLMSTYRLLEANPAVADEYRLRFGSIMVDEFQDTDILQVRIIESFCDEKLTTLTTVGDAQQSIYGFRGADLETYRSVRAQMAAVGSQEVSLDTNYRSHPDILAFVESIFSKPGFFGEEFLRIGAGPSNARIYPWAPAGAPRVSLFLAAGQKSPNGRASTHAADLRAAEAEFIAERFSKLAAEGAGYGEMAILMSSTKAAGPYLAALRRRGIPCAVSGGSDFYLQPEVATLTALLRVLELPDDDQPLLEVLASPLFDVRDGDLLSLRIIAKRELRNPPLDDIRPKVSLWDALEHQVARLPYSDGDGLIRAHRVLSEAYAAVGSVPLACIVAKVAKRSGWMEELRHAGAEGLAKAANIERFCDLVSEFERRNGPSAVLAAEHFRMMCDMAAQGSGAKGKPGRMVSLGNNAVQVMTIHASKGLEFPIVAVAQYARSSNRGPGGTEALSLSEEGTRYLALPPVFDGEGRADVKKRAGECAAEVSSFAAATDAPAFSGYAVQLKAQRDAEETQRLLYVALTRARDMLLLVSSDKSFDSKGELQAGLFADVAQAIFPSGFPAQGGVFELDTGCLVECVVKAVPYDADSPEESEEDEGRAEMPRRTHLYVADDTAPSLVSWRRKPERGVESYTSLARLRKEALADDEDASTPAGPVLGLRSAKRGEKTVSPVGSAFHLVAQWVAQQAMPGAMSVGDVGLSMRVDSAAQRYKLDAAQIERLRAAVGAWLGSNRFAQTCRFAHRMAEHAFCVQVAGLDVEGYIDLLCFDETGGKALIVDYKTGIGGPLEELQERYKLQASVYAYAVLVSGTANAVELAFVHPEADLLEVVFTFGKDDLPLLEAEIRGE